jgi:hypothetical protein
MNRRVLIATAAILLLVLGAAAAYLRLHRFTAAELGAKPFPLRDIDLPPPPSLNGVDYYGKLQLDLYIDADGTVEHVDAGESTLPARFRDEAVKAFSQARWEPGRKWGVKVPSVKTVEVDFEPPVRGIESSNTSPAGR